MPGLADHQNDARGALIYLFGPAGPSDYISSYNPLWCVLSPSGIGNIGFDYISKGLLSSYCAI